MRSMLCAMALHRHPAARSLLLRGAAPLLVAAALLLCHGVLGSLHLLSATGPPPGGEHAASHQDCPEGHCAGSKEYPAVLLTVFLGAALWLLCARRPRREISGPQAALHRPRRPRPPLPRGPTLPLLQVFLL
ncbi:MAG: hypothetical protein IN808_06935 [Rubrobacter sp.]|nr:hypothetical protein [Rubrobacter sp.]